MKDVNKACKKTFQIIRVSTIRLCFKNKSKTIFEHEYRYNRKNIVKLQLEKCKFN